MRRFLCVGGEMDGKLHSVPEGVYDFRAVSRLRPSILTSPVGEPPDGDLQEVRVITYTLRGMSIRINGEIYRTEVFAPEDKSDSWVLGELYPRWHPQSWLTPL